MGTWRSILGLLAGVLLAAPLARGQSILSVSPSAATVGESFQLSIQGDTGCFFDSSSEVLFSPASSLFLMETTVDYGTNTLSGWLAIPTDLAEAEQGVQDLTVITGVDACFGAALFEIRCATCATPVVLAVTPASAGAGESLTLTLTGENTHFDGTSEVAFSGNGIVVTGITAAPENDPAILHAQITLDATAADGLRSVTVTTHLSADIEVAVGENLFMVNGRPAATLDPAAGTQGETLALISLTGGPGGYSSQTTVSLGNGITIGQITSLGGDGLLLSNVVIAENAPVGPHTLTLQNPSLTVTDAFRVIQGPDTRLLSIAPDHGDRGHPALSVALVGQNTHFGALSTISFSTAGMSALDWDAADDTHASVTLQIAASAVEGASDVTTRAGGCATCEKVALAGAFTVTAPGTLDSATPAQLSAGAPVTVTFAATDGQFVEGQTQLTLDPPDGITIADLAVIDADHLSATLTVAVGAPGVARTALAFTGTEVAIGEGLLDVFSPALTNIIPAAGFTDSTFTLTLIGTDVVFDASTQVSFSGTGLTVGPVQLDSALPDQVTATLTIAPDAPPGTRDVTVTAGALTLTAPAAFQVLISHKKADEGGCGCGGSAGGSAPFGLPLLLLVLGGIAIGRRTRG